MRHCTSGGTTIAHDRIDLVAVHGNGGGAARFDRLPRPLAPGIELHTPTLPGFGGRPLGDVDGISGLAAALRDELPDGGHPIVLLGHGIGGSVALELLAEHPDAVDALVLHAPVGTRLDTRWFPRLMSPRWIRAGVQSAIASELLRPLWRRSIVREVPAPWSDEFLAAYADAEAFGAMFDWLTSDWFDSLPPRSLPAVLLWGSDDRVLGADQRADYHRLLPAASERTVDGWGHFPMLVDPDGYAATLASIATDLVARTRSEDATEPLPLPRLGDRDRRVADAPSKAALLDVAARAGAPVPPGVVVPADEVADGPAAIARRVAEALPAATVAVRSAFGDEDGEATANAGRYATVLGVDTDDHDALAAALEEVLASGPRVDQRAVLVQRLVDARHAGVAFTQPAFEDDLVDVVDGLADRLLTGAVAGERSTLARLADGESASSDDWKGRLRALLRTVRTIVGDDADHPGWDVEWADDGDRCWLVQLRPITAPPTRDAVLTLANHREILPDPPSVLMTSLIVEAAPGAFGYWRSHAPDLPAARPFIEEYAGRPLINLSLLTDTMRRLGLPTSLITDSMGGSEAATLAPTVGVRPRRLARHATALVGLGLDQLRAPANARRTIEDLHRRTGQLGVGFHGVTEAAVDVYVRLLHGMFALSTAVSVPLAALQRLGVSAEHHARHRSAGTAVWDDLAPLRALVAADPERQLTVERDEVPDDQRFRVAWARFLEQHGHRGVYESDLARPRYHEDPTPLLRMLADDDTHGQPPPPRTVLGLLSTPVWWQASRAIRAREQLRAEAMRSFDRLRQRLLALAEDAVHDGLLPAVDDVWLCTVDQLRGIDDGAAVTDEDLDATRSRRAEVAGLRLPDALRRSDDPLDFGPDGPIDDLTSRLRGIPLTSGDVTGTAWRLDEPDASRPPPDGPVVLVAPAVDAGWISVFARADAVVVETGGELSHGSIVLRERGVPAVTNVRGATRIRDGARVRVRAGAGVVELLDPPA